MGTHLSDDFILLKQFDLWNCKLISMFSDKKSKKIKPYTTFESHIWLKQVCLHCNSHGNCVSIFFAFVKFL